MTAEAQERKPQNKPYIDLRPMHFGILVGINTQDIEFCNVGPQTIVNDDVAQTETVLCDQDSWDPGFSVGVLSDWRLSKHINFRISPTMHFGSKHLTFRNLDRQDEYGQPLISTQDLKNTYIACPVNLKFSYGLTDAINYSHTGELQDVNKRLYSQSVTPGHSKMITLTFYFE